VSRILASISQRRYFANVVILDVALVPGAMWLVVALLLPDSGVGTGLLIVAFASAGPLGIKLTHLAGGDVASAIGLVVVLEVANLAAVPAWSSLVGIADSTGVVVDIIRTLVLLVLLPIGIGMLIGRLRPGLAAAWDPRLAITSSIGVMAIMLFVLVRHIDILGDGSGIRALAAAGLAIAFALGAGWLLGGPSAGRRTATSLVTGVRANAAALALASTAFAAEPDVAVGVVIASVASIVLSVVVAGLLGVAGRSRPARLGSSVGG
jgi:BASS family bile acid:Na+ symporter